jgi:hypothetical protein
MSSRTISRSACPWELAVRLNRKPERELFFACARNFFPEGSGSNGGNIPCKLYVCTVCFHRFQGMGMEHGVSSCSSHSDLYDNVNVLSSSSSVVVAEGQLAKAFFVHEHALDPPLCSCRVHSSIELRCQPVVVGKQHFVSQLTWELARFPI